MISAHLYPAFFPLHGPSTSAFDPYDAGVHTEQSSGELVATHQRSGSGEEQRLRVIPAPCLLNTWTREHPSAGAAGSRRPLRMSTTPEGDSVWEAFEPTIHLATDVEKTQAR